MARKGKRNKEEETKRRRRKLQQAPLSPYLSDSSPHSKINPSPAIA
jgi:hypothetical protein